jgi:dihydroorotate dehydrogenase
MSCSLYQFASVDDSTLYLERLSPPYTTTHITRSRPLRSLPRPILRQPLQSTSIRHASRYANRSLPRRFVSTTILLGGTAALIAYYYDSRSALHEHVAMPLIRLVADAETGHKMSIKLLSAPAWMRPRDRGVDGEELQAEVSHLSTHVSQVDGTDQYSYSE